MTTTTITRPTTCSGWLAALSQCLTSQTRADGTHFLALDFGAKWDDIRDDLENIVMEAHLGEFPNDWRFETVHSIASTLAEMTDSEDWDVDDFREESHEVADSLVDVYTGALLAWVSENTRRHQWDDDSIVQPTTDIMELIKLRQFEEIESMVQVVLSEVEKLTDA